MHLDAAIFTGPGRIVDTHCHYNLDPLFADWPRHWKKAQENGVAASWIPGTSLETSKRAVQIAEADPNLWALIGVHPADEATDPGNIGSTIAELETLIERDRQRREPKIIGVGEIGLDYFRIKDDDQGERQRQKAWFRAQLELARKHDLYVSLHVRDRATPEQPTPDNAYWDIAAIVAELEPLPPLILHCASGPLPYVRRMVAAGAFVGFAGNVTYPNATAIRDIWQATPAARRLIETDAPFLAPQSLRGQPCEPWMIAETARYLAMPANLG